MYQNLVQNFKTFFIFGQKNNVSQKWAPPIYQFVPTYIFNHVKIYFQNHPTEQRSSGASGILRGKGKPRPLKDFHVPPAAGPGDRSRQGGNEV